MTVEELIERLQEGLRLKHWMAHHEVIVPSYEDEPEPATRLRYSNEDGGRVVIS